MPFYGRIVRNTGSVEKDTFLFVFGEKEETKHRVVLVFSIKLVN